MEFPQEYPFKPPKLSFLTGLLHPSVDEKGQLCLGLVSGEGWRAGTRMRAVLEALLGLLEKPETERPLRPDLAELLAKDPQAFRTQAQAHADAHALPRPA